MWLRIARFVSFAVLFAIGSCGVKQGEGFVGSAVEAPSKGRVGGTVSDPQGTGIPQVNVVSLDAGTGSVTDNDGRFRMDLISGDHRLVFSARYFKADTVIVSIIGDSTIVHDLVLESQY